MQGETIVITVETGRVEERGAEGYEWGAGSGRSAEERPIQIIQPAILLALAYRNEAPASSYGNIQSPLPHS